jgi:steroid delta-isomerase-like uncharacterized protein
MFVNMKERCPSVLGEEIVFMATEDNKAVVQRFFEAVGKGTYEEVGQVTDPGFTYYDTSTRALHGANDVEHLFTNFHRHYPDLNITIEELTDAEADRVVARYTMSGTHQVDNKQVTAEGMSISRIHDGKIQEMRVIWDVAGWQFQEAGRPGVELRCRQWWCEEIEDPQV